MGITIPTDELIFFRGVEATNQIGLMGQLMRSKALYDTASTIVRKLTAALASDSSHDDDGNDRPDNI